MDSNLNIENAKPNSKKEHLVIEDNLLKISKKPQSLDADSRAQQEDLIAKNEDLQSIDENQKIKHEDNPLSAKVERKYQRLKAINDFLFSSLLLLPLFFSIAWFAYLREPAYADGIMDLFAILITPIMFVAWFLSGEYVFEEKELDVDANSEHCSQNQSCLKKEI